MKVEISVVLGILGGIITLFLIIFGILYKKQDDLEKKQDNLKDCIHQQQIELEKLKSKGDLEQQTLDQVNKELFKIINELTSKNNRNAK